MSERLIYTFLKLICASLVKGAGLEKQGMSARACADAMNVLNLSFAAESEAEQDFTLIELLAPRAIPLEPVSLAFSRSNR